MSSIEDPNDFLNSGGVPSAKFPTVGTVVKGTVVSARVTQQRDFESGEPKTFDNGDPMKQIVCTILTGERDPEVDGDDGTRNLFIKGQMLAAVRTALRTVGAKLEPGGTLAVKYVGDGTPTRKGLNPPKQFEAAYKPGNKPVDDLLDDQPEPELETVPPSRQPSASDLLD